MFRKNDFAHIGRMFAGQFEPDGGNFLYRRGIKDAPIRVSVAERDEFVAAFTRRIRYCTWSAGLATLIWIGLAAWLTGDFDSTARDVAIWALFALMLALYLAGYFWAWYAPARELERRPREGPARSRDEVLQLTFSEMTYGQLGISALGALGFVLIGLFRTDGFDEFDRPGMFCLIVGGLLVAGVGIQAFRKWRYERRLTSRRHRGRYRTGRQPPR